MFTPTTKTSLTSSVPSQHNVYSVDDSPLKNTIPTLSTSQDPQILLPTHFHVHQCPTLFLCNTRTTAIHFYSNGQRPNGVAIVRTTDWRSYSCRWQLPILPQIWPARSTTIPLWHNHLLSEKWFRSSIVTHYQSQVLFSPTSWQTFHWLPLQHPWSIIIMENFAS